MVVLDDSKAFLEKWVTFTLQNWLFRGVPTREVGEILGGKVHPLKGFLVHSQISVEHQHISTYLLELPPKNQDSSDHQDSEPF